MRIVITLPDDFICAFMDIITKNKDGSYTNIPRIITKSNAEILAPDEDRTENKALQERG